MQVTTSTAECSNGGLPLPPARRRRGLTSDRPSTVAKAVRAGLADTIRGLEAGIPRGGAIEPKVANAITYALATVAGVARDERMEALEREVSELRVAVEGLAR